MITPHSSWVGSDQAETFTQLYRTFFQDRPEVTVEVETEGNRYEKLEDPRSPMIFGCRAGPASWQDSYEISNLLHEMGHFLEIDTARMGIPGWGLRHRQVYLMGRIFDEPVTCQGTMREARVMGYQIALGRLVGFEADLAETVEPLRNMSDFCFVPADPEVKDYNLSRLLTLGLVANETAEKLKTTDLLKAWNDRVLQLRDAPRWRDPEPVVEL